MRKNQKMANNMHDFYPVFGNRSVNILYKEEKERLFLAIIR